MIITKDEIEQAAYDPDLLAYLRKDEIKTRPPGQGITITEYAAIIGTSSNAARVRLAKREAAGELRREEMMYNGRRQIVFFKV